jgi:hypothetical protein
MRRRIMVVIAAVVLLLGAIALGVLAQQRYQLARIRAGENLARDLAGLNDPVPPAPGWEEWQYPKARVMGSAASAAVSVSGKPAHAGGHYAVLVTPDDFETVALFYTSRMKFADAAAMARSRSAVSSEGNIQGESSVVLDDSREAQENANAEDVRAKCLAYRSPSYDVTVFLSRGAGDSHTHIMLLYNPKVATRGEE